MKALALVLAAVCAAPLSAAQLGEPDSRPEAEVRALERKLARAQVLKDNFALDALFDNTLIYVEVDGTLLSKGDYLAKAVRPESVLVEVVVESMAVHAFDATVIVDGIYSEKRMRDGQVYVQRRRSMDTWVNEKGNWICVAAAARPAPR
jgi:hypothetical protein